MKGSYNLTLFAKRRRVIDRLQSLLFIIGLNVCFEGLIGYQGFDVPLLFSEDVCLLLIL